MGGNIISGKKRNTKLAAIGIIMLLIAFVPQAISYKSFQNNPPYEPSNPDPQNGVIDISIGTNLNWTGGDPDGDLVTYDVYFGITSPPPKVSDNQSNTTYDPPGDLQYKITYFWQIIAWDEFEAFTTGPIWNFTTVEKINREPVKPTISGVKGIHVPNRDYDYDIVTTDPDEDDIFYFIEWGDSTYEDWSGPYKSGENITRNHSWKPVTKLYEIRVKAKDIYNAKSDIGKMYVFVLNSRTTKSLIKVRFIVRIMHRFPILEKILFARPIFYFK